LPDRYLIVGLGNPGREYRLNRHNAGFILLDRLVEKHGLLGFSKRQGKALITTGTLGGAPVVLAKPQTFMNLSGEAVGPLVRFYDLPLERLLVCLDDIDLPLGTLRLRPEGGSAGQKRPAVHHSESGHRGLPPPADGHGPAVGQQGRRRLRA
jgi:PTH1 family peptidyl-tRNA hydrolase